MISLESKTLSKKINIHLLPTRKFKTVLVSVFLHQTLERELASKTALLPAVLERGTRQLPSFRDLKIRLEELYGAELRADVLKKESVISSPFHWRSSMINLHLREFAAAGPFNT